MAITKRAISTLSQNPNNPRVLKDKRFKDLQKSIKQDPKFLEARPIIVDTNTGQVVAGNQRLEAARALGMSEVPVFEAALTEEEAKRWALKDNLHQGEWDWDKLANEFDLDFLKDAGFDEKEMDKILGKQDHSEDDEFDAEAVAETIKEPITRRGDLWQLGLHRLLCGDSTDISGVTRLIGSDCPSMVFTSPPYAVGINYGAYEDTIENLREMLPKLSKLWLDLLPDGGFVVLNFGDIATARDIVGSKEPCEYPMALEYYPVFRADGWLLWSRRIWCKPNARVHSLQCIGSNRAATDFEHIWTFKKHGEPSVKRVDGKSPNGWFETDVKGDKVASKSEVHGAAFPVGLPSKMIEIHSKAGDIVLEPFCGTGTTLVACDNLQRTCYAMELEPKYCDVIIKRWEEKTGQKAKLIVDK